MILTKAPIRKIEDAKDFQEVLDEIRSILDFAKVKDEDYYNIANTYDLPIHLSYIIIENLRRSKELNLEDLSSVSFYAICRDILTPYKNKTFLFQKFFGLTYPYMKNTDERLEWFLQHDNGLTLSQKVAFLEEETSYNSMGVGRTRFEKSLARIYIVATKEEIERRRLQEYDGIWAAAVASFVQKERGDLTAAEMLAMGELLAEDNRITLKVKLISYLISRMGKIEIYFLANQITKFHDRVSRTSSLLRAFSKVFEVNYKTIERLTSMHSMVDVAKLVEEDKILEQFEKLVPFRTFRPMLAAKWMQQYDFPAYVEAKYDGVRLLVHKLGNKTLCFSRRRRNYMYKFPQINQLSTVIPAYSVILDGEITAQQWTPNGMKFVNVYELNDAIRMGQTGNFQLMYVVFDVIFLNGVELVNYPFKQRRELRQKLVEAMIHANSFSNLIIRDVESYEIYNKEQLINIYNQFVTAGYEGAIVKNPKSPYELGKRSEAWLKLKPKETLDATITGVIPIQDGRGLRAWGVRYAVKREDEYVNMGMIRGLDSIAGNRIAEIMVEKSLIVQASSLVDLSEGIESKISARFGAVKESMGFELVPDIVITIDSLGIIRKDGVFKLRNARFLHIREDKEVDEISTYYDVYNTYMNERME